MQSSRFAHLRPERGFDFRPKTLRIIGFYKTGGRITEPRNHETESIAQTVDFSEEERILGRPLTHDEKYEAIQQFNEFISLLREEYGKMIGAHVYVERDDSPKSRKKRPSK